MTECAVIGYGSWATTLVRQLTMKGVHVNWLVTNPEVREGILSDGHNPKYVRDAELNLDGIALYEDINPAVEKSSFVLLSCPSAYLKSVLAPLTQPLNDKYVISAIKGIVPDECLTILEYMHEKYGLPFHQLGLISGPTHAEEVSCGHISYLTAAGSSVESASMVADLFNAGNLRVDISTDIYGLEYAGVLKNIYAVMAGVASGLGYGDNFLAVLVAQAAAEMKMFMEKSYPFEREMIGKSYLGDLLVTCYSNFSRNRRLGQLIGKGCTVKSALNEMTMIAEGYFSANLIMNVCRKFGIEMPIVEVAYNILYKNASPRRSLEALSRKL